MTTPSYPPGNTTTSMGRPPFTDTAVPFNQLSPALRGMQTHILYLDPLGNYWDLAGPRKGRQGVRLAGSGSGQIMGDQNWPTEQVLVSCSLSWPSARKSLGVCAAPGIAVRRDRDESRLCW